MHEVYMLTIESLLLYSEEMIIKKLTMMVKTAKIRWSYFGKTFCVFLWQRVKQKRKTITPFSVDGKTDFHSLIMAEGKKRAPDVSVYWQGAEGWSGPGLPHSLPQLLSVGDRCGFFQLSTSKVGACGHASLSRRWPPGGHSSRQKELFPPEVLCG